ncbi:MFS transporter [Deinococcus sp. YIM 134068]|uniref:MFS transporter n=1 Tax=Deinococcus lichenicola TaxID=3118910 RepID=UPI002F956591
MRDTALPALFQNRPFAVLWGAQTFSGLGDGIFRVAQVALLLELTGSAAALSGLLLVAVVPGIGLALLGGALADRTDRRRLLVAANTVRGLLMAAFAGLALADAVTLWHLYLLAFAYGGVSALSNPAFDALLPALVPRESLQRAQALFLLGDNVAAILGPALGGVLLVAVGAGGAVAVNALSFGVLVAGLLSLRAGAGVVGETSPASIWQDIGSGLRYARGHPALLSLLGLFAVINLSGATLAVALPLLVTGTLRQPAAAYGLYLTAMNVGILGGAALMGRVRVRRRGLAILGSLLTAGLLGYLPLALAREVGVGLFAVLLIDGLAMVSNVLYPAWVGTRIPDAYRGRVFGLTSLVSSSLVPVGFVVAGVAANALGPPGALLGAGGLLVGAALLGSLVPALRRME